MIDNENLDSKKNIHALGVNYIYHFLDRAGFTIHEVITDPDHHFQLLAERKGRAMLIAVRTAHYPDMGTLDKLTREQLIKESEKRNAIPHFAGLALTSLETNDKEVDGLTEKGEYKVVFNGITVVDKSKLLAANS
jgi:hypothetical protein